MSRDEMTQKQHEVIKFIEEYSDANGFPPTFRDVAEAMGITVRAAHDHIKRLRKKGYLTYEPRKPRTLRIVEQERK